MATVNLRSSLVEEFAHFPVAADTVISVGDLVYFDGTTLKAASAFTWDTSDALTRREMKYKFAGVAADAHRSGDAACLLKVCTVAEVDATVTSSTFAIGDLLGVAGNASSTLYAQQLVKVVDGAEAIGMVTRKYGTSTTVRAVIWGQKCSSVAIDNAKDRVAIIPYHATLTAATLVSAVPCEKVFGGAAQVIAFGFNEVVAVTVQAAIVNLTNTSTDLASLTVPTAGAAIGRYTEADMSADAANIFAPPNTLSIKCSQAPTAGQGAFWIRYRPLA